MKEQTNIEDHLSAFTEEILDNIIKICSFSGLFLFVPLLYVDNFNIVESNTFVYFAIVLVFLLHKFKDRIPFYIKGASFFLIVFMMVFQMLYQRGLYSSAPLFIIVISALLPLFLKGKYLKFIYFIFLSAVISFTYVFSRNILVFEIENKELNYFSPLIRAVVIIITSFAVFNIIDYCNELLKKNYSSIKSKNEKLIYYHSNLEKLVEERTKELEESLIREQEAGILKTNFISMASHEFRTPLASIQGLVELVLKYSDRMTPNQITERLEKVQVEVGTMTTMLEDVLVISNGGARNKSFNPVTVNIISFVKEIIFDYQQCHKDTRKVDFEFVDEVVNCNVDPKLMKQVVVNLFSNALKYSEYPSPITIRIIKEKNDVVFSISDQGIGISKEEQKLIFQPFFRASNIENVSGTGLGLAIIEQAVALQNGIIHIHSELDKGTTFKVVFTNVNLKSKNGIN